MDIGFEKITPLTFHYNKIENSLWNSNILFKQKEKILIYAKSGKGKTTLTYFLAGIRKDFEGNLFFDDRNIQQISSEDWATIRQKQLSFVFQDLQLFTRLTTKENLLIKNQLTNYYTEKEIYQLCEQLKIAEKWNVPCTQLSLGQQQRVAILRALCQPFEWLVLDEPFSHLDPENTEKAYSLILEKAKANNASIILTSLNEKTDFNFDKIVYL